jgi:hypothetical protein
MIHRSEGDAAWDALRGVSLFSQIVAAVVVAVAIGVAIPSILPRWHRQPATESFDARLDRLTSFVATHRGLSFVERPRVERLSPAAFHQRLETDGTLDLASTTAARPTLQALGLTPPTAGNQTAAIADGADTIGFYDTLTRSVVIQSLAPGPYMDYVLVHELTHALQDQRFGLGPLLSQSGDAGMASVALVEGDAKVIADEFLSSLPPRQVDDIQDAGLRSNDQLFRSTYYLSAASFPYVAGSGFVHYVLTHGGTPRLNDALRDPPTSTAQLLHPDRFIAGDRPMPVTPPAAQGPVVDDGVLGEFDLALLLEPTSGASNASDAVNGWAGGSYVTWTVGPRACAAIALVMHTAADSDKVLTAIRRWVVSTPDRTVSRAPDGRIAITACA